MARNHMSQRHPDVDTVTAPSDWASALVNGDFSGLEEDDTAACIAWADTLEQKGWVVVGVASDENGDSEDPHFTWSYRLYGGNAGGGNVVDYIVHRTGGIRRWREIHAAQRASRPAKPKTTPKPRVKVRRRRKR